MAAEVSNESKTDSMTQTGNGTAVNSLLGALKQRDSIGSVSALNNERYSGCASIAVCVVA